MRISVKLYLNLLFCKAENSSADELTPKRDEAPHGKSKPDAKAPTEEGKAPVAVASDFVVESAMGALHFAVPRRVGLLAPGLPALS